MVITSAGASALLTVEWVRVPSGRPARKVRAVRKDPGPIQKRTHRLRKRGAK